MFVSGSESIYDFKRLYDGCSADKYIDNYHLHKNNIFLLRYKLHTHDNPKEFINAFFAGIESGNVAVITEAIVYDEDAYLNAAAAQMDDKHRRFYTINEILDFTKTQ